MPNVQKVEVSFDLAQAIIQHNQTEAIVEQLKAAIMDAGFEIIN